MVKENMEPIQIWTASAGPNGWKPVIILEELNVPYTLHKMSFDELVGPEYRKLTPVGKIPLMFDPNTDIRIFESGAIILYLIENYDRELKLTYTSAKERALLNQWLMYQMSAQGPMYGQYGWFKNLHPERLSSCIDRYTKQMHFILNVLEKTLSDSSSGWLVGEKCTYVDLAFFPWHEVLPLVMQLPEDQTPLLEYPHVMEWHEKMRARASTSKVFGIRKQMMQDERLDATGLPEGKSWDEMMESMDRSVEKTTDGTA